MSNPARTLAAGALAAAAAASPMLVNAAPSARDASPDLLPAVMHFKIDYSEARDAPEQLHAAVRAILADFEAPQMMPTKPGCETISGSGRGWDDSDYRGPGC